MATRKVAILLTLSIFGMMGQPWADPVKSMNDGAYRLTMTKMDENKGIIQKKTDPATDHVKSFKKGKAKFQDLNSLRTMEEKKRSRWVDSVDKVIYSHESCQNAWRNKFLSPRQATEAKSSNSDSGQPLFKPYSDGSGYFEEGRTLTTLKLLQSKKEEAFKDIFMGFRFSFDLMSGNMFLEMNVTPPSERVSGFLIRFRPASAP